MCINNKIEIIINNKNFKIYIKIYNYDPGIITHFNKFASLRLSTKRNIFVSCFI